MYSYGQYRGDVFEYDFFSMLLVVRREPGSGFWFDLSRVCSNGVFGYIADEAIGKICCIN